MNTIISTEAKKAIDVGRANHWRFRTVQKQQEWVYETVDVPQVGKDRIDVLRAAGVRIKGFVVAHEAPRLLPAPKETPKRYQDLDFKNTSQIVPDMSWVGEFFFMFFALLFQAIALDPALIVELEDGTWLEVMTWYE